MEKPENGDAGVLVVEDDAMLAFDIEGKLADLGFAPIYLAHDIHSGREYLNSKTLCLAVLDVNLGSDLVYPLAAEIVARQIPIVFSTALTASEMPLEWTTYPILTKPWGLLAFQKALGMSDRVADPR